MHTNVKVEDNYSCAVVIPVYKERPDKNEMQSFCQCLRVLHNYTIMIVTYLGLNLTEYDEVAKKYFVQLKKIYYSKFYFEDVVGYNKLMKSKSFYMSFSSFRYILIYQLDAYVFRDELEYWCKQGYDYIGAPLFAESKDKRIETDTLSVGNGGLSLRKVSFFLEVLSWRGPLLRYSYYKGWKFLPYMLGWHNNVRYFLKDNCNEDFFFTKFLLDSYFPPNIPTPEIAALFSFERFPSYLYELCNNHLPFGCHAYMRYEYDYFWKKFIY